LAHKVRHKDCLTAAPPGNISNKTVKSEEGHPAVTYVGLLNPKPLSHIKIDIKWFQLEKCYINIPIRYEGNIGEGSPILTWKNRQMLKI